MRLLKRVLNYQLCSKPSNISHLLNHCVWYPLAASDGVSQVLVDVL